MRPVYKAFIIAVFLMPFGFRPASAQAIGLITELIVQCRADSAQFCRDVEPGGGRIAACLYARLDDLSPRCNRAMRDAIALKSCKEDYHRFCGGVTPGEGRIISCLHDNGDRISTACHDALAGLRTHGLGQSWPDRSRGYAAPGDKLR